MKNYQSDDESVCSDIELSSFEEEGLGDVLLDEEARSLLAFFLDMLLDLLVGGEDLVIADLAIYLLDYPVLLIYIHIPIVNLIYFQALEVSLGENFPLIIHEPTYVEGRKHDLGEFLFLSLAVFLQREIDT